MTPATYMNPSSPSPFPLIEQLKEDQQLHFFTTPPRHNFFNTPQEQRATHQQVDKYILHGGCDHQVVPSSSMVEDTSGDNYNVPNYKLEDENGREEVGPTKWMSSKMRVMKKMMIRSSSTGGISKEDENSTNTHNNNNNNNNNIIRVCSDCNTTKTPLWRSGPQGPKSLCNACGIRQRKARRALAMAMSNGTVHGSSSEASSPTKPNKFHLKDKKSKKSFKLTTATPPLQTQKIKKPSFEDFAMSLTKNISAFQRVLPKDEEEAAILLMALSCGLLIHS